MEKLKKHVTSKSYDLNLWYGHVVLVIGYPCFESFQLPINNMDVYYQVNPFSTNIHIQILQTDLYIFL